MTDEIVAPPVAAETKTDVLGHPWQAETIALPPDAEGEVVATLVSRRAAEPTERAVLHVHGFADYFFQTEYGEWWLERDHDMYALDLRKYGRSIRPHQTATYVADLEEYFAELDHAWQRITERDGHTQVILSGHSTGGLVVALWADARQPKELAGIVLNSPWLDLQGKAWMRTPAGDRGLDRIGRVQPMRVFPREVSGVYGMSLHREHAGEWEFDLSWKPLESFPVRFGWLRAIRAGHARVHAGSTSIAPSWSCPRTARPSPPPSTRTRTRPTSSSTSRRSAAGRARSAATSPRSPYPAPSTTSCCPARRPASGPTRRSSGG